MAAARMRSLMASARRWLRVRRSGTVTSSPVSVTACPAGRGPENRAIAAWTSRWVTGSRTIRYRPIFTKSDPIVHERRSNASASNRCARSGSITARICLPYSCTVAGGNTRDRSVNNASITSTPVRHPPPSDPSVVASVPSVPAGSSGSAGTTFVLMALGIWFKVDTATSRCSRDTSPSANARPRPGRSGTGACTAWAAATSRRA